jgi:hypothetical protein
VTVCAKLVHDAYDRPENLGWASTSKGELILTLNFFQYLTQAATKVIAVR